MIRGNVKVTKTYSNGDSELIFDDSNIVTDGLGYALVNIFTNGGSTDVEDHQVAYFQLGDSRRDLSSVNFFLKSNFYTLSSAFSEADYGLESPFLLKTTPQVMVKENFVDTDDLVYFVSSGVFSRLDKESYSSYGNSEVVRHRIVLDEDSGNGKSISELGLFMKNPDGAAGADRTILAAYRSLETPIVKTAEFSVTIEWVFSFGSDNSMAAPGRNYSYVVQVLSGTGGSLASMGTGTDYNEYFIVNTPASYDVYPNGSPLVVGTHGYDIVGLGLSAAEGVTVQDLTVSGNASGLLLEKVLDSNWFMVHPGLGKNGTVVDAYPPAASIDAGNKAQAFGLWEETGLRHVKLAVSWMKSQYPIDDSRIYMWGHSSGGVAPIVYASKLLDPTKDFMVAGVVSESPDGLNYENFFRASPARQDKLRFWTSGQGRIEYISYDQTNNNYTGANWSDIAGEKLEVSATIEAASSYMPQFHKNSAFVFLHDTSDVSAALSVAKNIRHIPLVLSWGEEELSLEYVSGINMFDIWATSGSVEEPGVGGGDPNDPVSVQGSGLNHPNYFSQIRTDPGFTRHGFDNLQGWNGEKRYIDAAWDHLASSVLTTPTGGEFCIYDTQRVFNVLATPSSTEWDEENCGGANFYFRDVPGTLSSVLSSMNNIGSFQHYGIDGSPVRKLQTNRRVTLHQYPDEPSKVIVNGEEFRYPTPIGGGTYNNNYLAGAQKGDPFDFGGPCQAEAGDAGNWIIGSKCPNAAGDCLECESNIIIRNDGQAYPGFSEQKDPYGGGLWDYLYKLDKTNENFAHNRAMARAEVGSVVDKTFTFSVYFQLGNLASVNVNLAMYATDSGYWGVGGTHTNADGVVYSAATIDTNTLLACDGCTQGFNDWQRVTHTVKYEDNGNDHGTRLNPIIIFGDIDNLESFDHLKYVALSHAKLEDGDTATSFLDDFENPVWEHNPGEGTLLLMNPISQDLQWEITP